jgi:cholesterol transport system auxiliary component
VTIAARDTEAAQNRAATLGGATPGQAAARITLAGIALIAASLALSGCGSLFTSKKQVVNTYVLSAAETMPARAAVPGNAAATSLVLLQPVVTAGLDSERIAVAFADGRMDAYQNSDWAAPLSQLLQDEVIESLRRASVAGQVFATTAPFVGEWQLRLDVTHFEAVYKTAGAAPLVRVSWVATLGRRSDRVALATLNIDQQLQADTNQLSSVLRAFNGATGSALAQLDDWTHEQLQAAPPLTPPATAGH